MRTMAMGTLDWKLAFSVTLAVLAIASLTDLSSRRVPNWLVVPFMAAGLVVPGVLEGWHGVTQSLEGFGLGALIYGILYWLGGMGMGDVKLVAAIGAWVGPQQLILAIVLTFMIGGIMTLCWALFGGFLGELSDGTGDLILGFRRGLRPNPEFTLANKKRRKLPYVPAIALGTLISFFSR